MAKNKTALIFGVTGQDGSYLSELLLKKGYIVTGVNRRSSVDNTARIKHIINDPNFSLIEGDLTDPSGINEIISKNYNECYNLAAMSHVGTSFEQPTLTFQINTIGVLNILEAIRKYSTKTRFYQANTSEMFGNNKNILMDKNHGISYFQDEDTPLAPASPYAVSKVAAHHLVQNYRIAYNLHASAGILFNHESKRRGENFVTRKITKWIANFFEWLHSMNLDSSHDGFDFDDDYIYVDNMRAAKYPKLRLGNINSFRDWGHASDYVLAMYMMLQQNQPDDYVIATGETHSVKEFLDIAFSYVCLNYQDFICIDPKFYRPSDVEYLCGRPQKAKEQLGWMPKTSFRDLVTEMVDSDLDAKRLFRPVV